MVTPDLPELLITPRSFQHEGRKRRTCGYFREPLKKPENQQRTLLVLGVEGPFAPKKIAHVHRTFAANRSEPGRWWELGSEEFLRQAKPRFSTSARPQSSRGRGPQLESARPPRVSRPARRPARRGAGPVETNKYTGNARNAGNKAKARGHITFGGTFWTIPVVCMLLFCPF